MSKSYLVALVGSCLFSLGGVSCVAPFTAEFSTDSGGQAGAEESGTGGSETVHSGGAAGSTSPLPSGGSSGAGMLNLAGAAGEPSTPEPISSCLTGFQSLACAKQCTDQPQTGCESVLSCFIQTNSLDKCQAFSTIAITLATAAERNCCP